MTNRPRFHHAIMMFIGSAAVGLAGSEVSGGSQEVRQLGLPPLVHPTDNPITAKKVDLGRKLFFDKRLSLDNSVSCATCHDPTAGFADPHPTSIGVKGKVGERNSTSVLNSAHMEPLMWDGKAASLEEQALLPFLSPDEFDLSPEEAALKLQRQGYEEEFREVFGEGVSATTISKALAAY